ncbi:beta-ketoacyl synthase N-terminal-like domain-containing protein [Actinomyces israelii]|uniref:Beta-ketoacyl synthase N-terminal-like domain-containing protein n=1 Tax=Actinomyces israelii TaxID=1659 RepID=A0ABT4I427_9ACTO|nr:beta-ketoacyl synthase N-terminal-like domain-containing protein [Actinomyces israelii]MCZ0856491.1 beta-ketoacyl synthase N-terminal-like domain-containing protein [Actinomyces israelii]
MSADSSRFETDSPSRDAGAMSCDDLVAWILEHASPGGEITASSPLGDLGLSSRKVLEMSAELSERLGRDVRPVSFWEFRTVGELAEGIIDGPAGDAHRSASDRSRGVSARPDEEIAIVGCAVRVPGAANCDELWQLLERGESSEARTDLGARSGGASSFHRGSYFTDPYAFDHTWFSVTAREAETMDPQQRLLLELTHEAFEDAGLTAGDHHDDEVTGVFVGVSSYDHGLILHGSGVGDAHSVTGSALSVVSGRIAYVFGLSGPAISVDTACSSSLTALHLAVQSLRLGECSTAVVGGVNMVLSPQVFASLKDGGFLAADGRCKSFGADADGYGRGEGDAVLILRRASDVERGHARAMILGSALNSDGRSNGLTAPQLTAQVRVMRAACRAASISPDAVGYVEAHGTGTPLGDPIEAESTARVYGAGRPAGEPCIIGSIKSNIGHTEAAAGLMGIIKVLISLEHDAIPPSIGADPASPAIPFGGNGLALATGITRWPRDGRRVAGVSSFSFAGANAHVIVAEAEDTADPDDRPDAPGILVLSAASADRLEDYARAVGRRLEEDRPPLQDVIGTMAGRLDQECRYAMAVRSIDEAVDHLRERSSQPPAPRATATVLVADGQGGQWPGMGRHLVDGSLRLPGTVVDLLERLDEEIRASSGWSLLDGLADDAGPIAPERIQPRLVALELAQAERWRAAGLVPDAVVGHSVGEFAAAAIAGVISPEAAVRIAVARGRICAEARGTGATAVVAMSAADVERLLDGRDGAWVAGVNSRRQTLVGGRPTPVQSFLDELDATVFRSLVSQEYAFHSPLMAVPANRLRSELALLEASGEVPRPRPPRLPLYSTVTGGPAVQGQYGIDYWAENLRGAVRFADALDSMALPAGAVAVELGPHPGLRSAMKDLEPGIRTLASARRGDLQDRTFMGSWAALIEARVLSAPPPPSRFRRLTLPSAPWHHRGLRPSDAGGDTASTERTPTSRGSAEENGAAASVAPRSTDAAGRSGFLLELAAVLHEPVDEIPRDVPLVSLGLDSIMGLELARRLEARWRVRISPSQFLGGFSVADIEECLAYGPVPSDEGDHAPGGEPVPETRTEELLGRLDALDDSEVDRLLAELSSDEEWQDLL